MKNWIIIANKAEAKIFSAERSNHDLKEVKSLINESAKMKEKDLVSDAPGKSQSGFSGSGSRAMDSDNKALKHALDIYSSDIAEYIKKAKDQNVYDELIVVAEPRMLGNLVSELEKKKLSIFNKVGKELIHMNNAELSKVLKEEIKDSFPLV